MRPGSQVIVSRAAATKVIYPNVKASKVSRNTATDASVPATVLKSALKKTKPIPGIVDMARAAFRKPVVVSAPDTNMGLTLATRNTCPGPTMPVPNIKPNIGTRNTNPGLTMPGSNVAPKTSVQETRPETTVPANIRTTSGKGSTHPDQSEPKLNIVSTLGSASTHPDPPRPSSNTGPTLDMDNRPDPTMPPPGVIIVSRAAKKPAPLVHGIISRHAIIGSILPRRRNRKVNLSHIIRDFESGKSSDYEDLNIISMPFEHDGGQNESGEPVITNAMRNRHRLKLLRRYDLNNPIGGPQNIRPEFLRSLLTRPKPRRVKLQVVDRRIYHDYNDPNFTGYGTFSFLTACRIFSLIVLGYLMLQYKDS